MAFVAISVSAQWTAPVAPATPQLGVDYEADGSTAYYLLNVGCGQFITGANSWSTQISVGSESNPGLELVVEPLTDEDEEAETYPGAVKLRLNPEKEQTVNGASGERKFTGTYLFRDSETSGFIDHASQSCWYWTIVKAVNGSYYLQSAYDAETESFMGGFIAAATQYAAASEAGAAVIFNASAEDANIEWQFIPVETFDKEAVSAALAEYLPAMKMYKAKLDLYKALVAAQEAGVNTDAASTVYNSDEATEEDLYKAASQLRADIKAAEFGDKWNSASEEEPLDVTNDVLVNPSFDNGFDGWSVVTGSTGEGNPATADWDSQGVTTEGPMMGTEGDWGKNAEVYHRAFNISQHIDFLPAGIYKFTCQGFYRPDENGQAAAELYALFNDGTEQVSKIAHIDDYGTAEKLYEVGSWASDQNRANGWTPNGMSGAAYHFHHYTGDNEELDYTSVLMIKVLEPIAGITIGIRVEGEKAWVIFDNFTLTYYGQVDPNKLELADLYKKNLVTYNIDEAKANQDVKRTYEEAMEAAEDPTENFEALLNNLKAATDALVSSIQDYVELEEVYASTRELSDQLENTHGDWDVTDLVSSLADDIRAKIDDELADHDYLEAVRDSAINSVRNFIASGDKVKPGDDLTFLLINADFQKTVADNHVVPGWTYVGDELITDLSKQWGNIEVFNKSAEIQQTIKNMPVGAYDVTVQGFVRGNQEQVVLYAGDSKTSFKNISEEYMTEPSFGDPEVEDVQNGVWPYDSHDTENDVYRPNSMQGASIYFATVNPETNEPYYTNHCRIVLKEAGDLTIGVKVSFPVDSWQWCLWDNFRIEYAGAGVELFADEIHNRQDAVRAALADEDAFVTAKAKDMADLAIMAGDEALGGDNLNDVFAAMDQLEEAEAYLKEGKSLAAQLSELAQFYDETMIPNVESGDTEYETFITLVSYPMPQDFEDNDELKAALEKVKNGWAGYVLYDVKDIASEENPQDVTPIIYNTDYIDPIQNTPSNNGWTITKDGGNDAVYIDTDIDLDYSAQEFYNNNSFDIHQELTGLEPGYYRVSLQGYYRAGYPSADDSLAVIRNAALYAETQVNTFQSPLLNAMEGAQVVMEGYGDESEIILAEGTDDETYVFIPNDMAAACQYFSMGYYPNECVFEVGEDGLATIGIRRDKHIEGDWTIFTFWALDYLGKTAPTAIEEVAVADNKNVDLKAYDLTGRRVQKLTKGMYIVNGRKVLVK